MKLLADGSIPVIFVDGTTRTGMTAPDGSTYVFDATDLLDEDDNPIFVGLHHDCGAINVTILEDGATRTGLYAKNGSYNIIEDAEVTKGVYHPCGAYRITDLTT